jgi:AraC-like DNA-binding protein
MIRNMVSERCKQLLRSELKNFGLHLLEVEMGQVSIEEELSYEEQLQLNIVLKRSGLEVVQDRKKWLTEKIKAIVAEIITENAEAMPIKFSAYLSKKLQYDYHYLSNVFGLVEGTSLERFIIAHKTDLIKKILDDDKLSLTEIADKLHYSSAAHLSNQFKKVTGYTPGVYRQIMRAERMEERRKK